VAGELGATPLRTGQDSPFQETSRSSRFFSLATDEWLIKRDKLKLRGELGRGGFGTVFKGEWLHTAVAVKVIPKEQVTARDILTFKNELKILLSVRHENCIQFYGAVIEENTPLMLVLERMHGNMRHKLTQTKAR